MPHPERYIHAIQHPQRRGIQGYGDGLLIFKNAYEYVKTLLIRTYVESRYIAPGEGTNDRGETEGNTYERAIKGPIMHFQKLIPIMKLTCTLLWLLLSSTFNFETALSCLYKSVSRFER